MKRGEKDPTGTSYNLLIREKGRCDVFANPQSLLKAALYRAAIGVLG